MELFRLGWSQASEPQREAMRKEISPMPSNRWRTFIGLLLALQFVPARLPADAQQDPLAQLRPGHPRLLMNEEDLAAAVAAAKSDPLRATLHKRIIATAETILGAPAIRQPDSELGQEQDRYAVYYILTCAMAYRLTGDGRFLARAKSDLLTAAAFPDWNPHHFLSVGEMSFAVAIGYDWLYRQLQPSERSVIRRALLDHSLSFADSAYRSGGPTGREFLWAIDTNNQNQVCNSGLLSAALAVADEEPALARAVIAGVRRSLPRGMSAYSPDGGYPEGPGYWTYGTTYAVIAFAELGSALGTDFGLASAPGFDRTANYYEGVEGPSGPVFNYADSTDDLQNSPARAWLAERYHQPAALRSTRALLADSLARERAVQFDRTIQRLVVNRFFALHAVWFPQESANGKLASELPLDLHFGGIADIAVFRSAWNDPRAIFLGFKAGENADHHGHLDLGSFVLDADGQRWAMDLGSEADRGSYNLPGWGDNKAKRWTYFRANNYSHNTVTPGGALQNRHVVAPIVAFGSTLARGFAIADLVAAYSNEAASLRRGVALLDRARVLVQDEFMAERPGIPLRWTMVTPAEIALGSDGRSATLIQNGRSLRVDLLEPSDARLCISSTRPPTAAENQNTGTAMLAIDLTPPTGRGVSRLAVLLSPVGEKWPKLEPPALVPLADWR